MVCVDSQLPQTLNPHTTPSHPNPIHQARWAAFVPALMSSVLLFMDQNITVRLVDSPAHRLKKGYGLHLVRFAIPPAFTIRMSSNEAAAAPDDRLTLPSRTHAFAIHTHI